MPTISPQSTGAETAAAIASDPPAQARQSSQRTTRLTEYIQAHTGENIEVVLTPHVQTACVLPADADSLIDADATDFDHQAARQLVAAVDGDYLVLISTNPANLEHLPLDDQLTADRAQQFGLSLHELGHIRYTNISAVAAHLEARVDDEYQEFVHGLINYAEDAAIEHQLREAQSQLAADRLELVNRSLTQPVSDLEPHDHVAFTYRDAIQSYLYDHGIYDSGKRDVLLDPDDNRITFQSPDDAHAFAQTQDALDDLLATVLSEPDSVTRGDAVLDCWEQTIKPLLTPMNDQQSQDGEDDDASGGGSPDSPPTPSPSSSSSPNESDQDEPSDPSTDPDTGAEPPDAAPDEAPSGDGAADSDPGDALKSLGGSSGEPPKNAPEGEQGKSPADGEPSEPPDEETPSESPPDFDPENVSLEQTQDDHSADVLAYPDIGTAEDADELAPADVQSSDIDGDACQSESDAKPNAQAETGDTSPADVESGESSDESATSDGATEGVDGEREGGAGESVDDDSNSPPGDTGESTKGGGSASDPARESAPGEDGVENLDDGKEVDGDASSSGPSGESSRSSNGQSSLSTFLGAASAGSDSSSDASDGDEASSDGSVASDTPDSPGSGAGDTGAPDGVQSGADGEGGEPSGDADDADTDATQSESAGGPAHTREPTGEDALDTSDSDGTSEDEQPDDIGGASEEAEGPRAQPVEPAYDDSLDDRQDALSTDHDAAHEEADRATPDQDALARDLEETAAALGDLADDSNTAENDHSSSSRGRGSQGAGKGSLDSLSILPQVGEQASQARWQAATAGADAVGGTLRMVLRERRRDQVRSGVTSGSFDRRRVGALARGDVNVFSVRHHGEEKQYDLVLVLDRSSSMRFQIEIAEDAIVRFALACEDLGINVAIMDFVNSNARLIKPFSVETEHVQASLMSGETGGGTPLSDALGLARSLLEQRRDTPLVIIVTDGKPGSPDAYQQELQQCFAPVCGLTLALDTPQGDGPARAADVERFYDRHLFVRDASQLDARLDQFAVMFDGL